MKVLLINSEVLHVKHNPTIPLGLLSIATYLTDRGHTVQIFDRTVERGSLKKQINSFSPDIVGISALGFKSLHDAIKVSKALKKYNLPVVWGGHIPSLIPDVVLKSELVDYVVIGEGELTFLALLNAILEKTSLHDIDGLAFIEDGKIIINKKREFADLSQLPIIDFSFVDPKKYFSSNVCCERVQYMYSSKGCHCNCTFCYNPSYSENIWRPRPPEHFLSEIKYLVDNFSMDGVFFVDDLFTPSREYLRNICNKFIESNINFVWGCEFRGDTCTKEDIQLMYDAGCRWLFFGIESGSDERQKKIKKNLNLTKTKETINYCNEIGIVTSTSFILNYPDQTEEELRETIRYIQQFEDSILVPSFYGPIPKSEMYDSLEESGKLLIPESCEEYGKFKMMDLFGKNYSDLPDKELRVISAHCYWRSFLRKYPNDEKESRFIVKKAIVQTIDVFKRGTLNSVRLVFLSAKEFLEIFFYATMFPKIRKKYGLKKNRK